MAMPNLMTEAGALGALVEDTPRDELVEPAVPGAPAQPGTERAAGTTLPPPFPPSVLAQATSAGNGPALSGSLEEFRLPDLLELLRNTHRTGLLMCTASAGIGMVELSRGMITAAHSPNALDLRQHFLTSPKFTPERRRALAALPAACFGDDAIADVLVSRDLIPRDEVERARVARIYSACREMLRWTAGRFSFDPGVAVETAPALALSAHGILMQLYQEQDEQAGE